MEKSLNRNQVLEIAIKSKFLHEVIGETAYEKLIKKIPSLNTAGISVVLEVIPDLEDLIFNISQAGKFESFGILSDDEGGSDAGPWWVHVYGACGMWVVKSVDLEDLWFDNRASAINAAYEYAHELVIETYDLGG